MIELETLMQIRPAAAHDPAIASIVADGGLNQEDYDDTHTTVAVVGEEEGVPVGFVSGLIFHDQPVLEHIAIRPGFRSEQRTRALADAFAEAMRQRGFSYVLTAVNLERPDAGYIQMLLSRWPAHAYHRAGAFEWWVKYLEEADE